MCFFVILGSKPKRAKYNITCFKLVHVTLYSQYGYNNTRYKLNVKTYAKRRSTKLIRAKDLKLNHGEINAGIHSYRTFEDLIKIENRLFYIVLKCCIPKGAFYYKNDSQYVSTAIIPRKII